MEMGILESKEPQLLSILLTVSFLNTLFASSSKCPLQWFSEHISHHHFLATWQQLYCKSSNFHMVWIRFVFLLTAVGSNLFPPIFTSTILRAVLSLWWVKIPELLNHLRSCQKYVLQICFSWAFLTTDLKRRCPYPLSSYLYTTSLKTSFWVCIRADFRQSNCYIESSTECMCWELSGFLVRSKMQASNLTTNSCGCSHSLIQTWSQILINEMGENWGHSMLDLDKHKGIR